MLPVILSVVLAAGASGSAPPPRATTDMVSVRYADSIASPNHLGHWPAPRAGSPVFLSANAYTAGVGAGTVTFGVLVEGQGTVCTLNVPCTLAPGAQVQKATCSEGAFTAATVIHLEFSHTCTTAPEGTLVAGFEYN